ncbi:hypothetical protein SCMU_03550 [Sinomonas cyclohexanicum]|uniref:DUF4097 domain-containing protein n=1 Tax=Sinomonas cyclohexanicum TaxID=322009 RepID=A0ABM7PR32_SINCY|nr:DUF4097 family beta strand repeat-containing protein [Corynebacterium cyclohexanicum]BCT74513.1 hypothetical protein SCMU_03550 [Corynebacterium cyclohexanicum]
MDEFETEGPVRAVLDVAYADVIVRSSATSTARVDVAPARSGRKADEEAAAGTAVRFADGRLEVSTPKQRVLGVLGRLGSVVVTVDLPSGSDLEASLAYGDVITSGPLGRVIAKTRAGTVRVEDGASVDLKSSAGDVEAGRVRVDGTLAASAGMVRVEDLTGAVQIKCGTGGVSLGRVAGSAHVTCPYGSIRVREAVSGSLNLTSTYSDLIVGLAEGTAARLDVSTNYGRIRNELTRSDTPPQATERLEVTARSNYGSVTIRRA